jgi:hypothetical protein
LWDRRIGWKTKGLRRNRAKDPEMIALVFPHKVKPGRRMRRGAIDSVPGNDAREACTDPRRRRERG